MRRKRRRAEDAEEQAAALSAADLPVPQSVSTPVASPAVPEAAPTPDRVDALTDAIGGELGRLRGEIRGRDADLVHALQQVAASYDRVAARLDDERRVQELLAEALVRIDRRLATIEGRGNSSQVELPRGPRVIGGSIEPRQDIPRIES